jgi:multidrug resistance efflux pump
MVVRMHDVQVVSTKVSANGDDASLRQQRLGLTESVAQVRSDLDEAERQLSVTSSLEKRHLASSAELARARGAMALLTARLVVQQQRLALIEHQLAEWMPFEEEIVLAAAKMDAITRTGAQ